MRISDWISDVFSSDLLLQGVEQLDALHPGRSGRAAELGQHARVDRLHRPGRRALRSGHDAHRDQAGPPAHRPAGCLCALAGADPGGLHDRALPELSGRVRPADLIFLSDPRSDGSNYLGTADWEINYWLSYQDRTSTRLNTSH